MVCCKRLLIVLPNTQYLRYTSHVLKTKLKACRDGMPKSTENGLDDIEVKVNILQHLFILNLVVYNHWI